MHARVVGLKTLACRGIQDFAPACACRRIASQDLLPCCRFSGLFEALLGPEDAVISDELNHASIIDGIRLCKAKRYRFVVCELAALLCAALLYGVLHQHSWLAYWRMDAVVN